MNDALVGVGPSWLPNGASPSCERLRNVTLPLPARPPGTGRPIHVAPRDGRLSERHSCRHVTAAGCRSSINITPGTSKPMRCGVDFFYEIGLPGPAALAAKAEKPE